MIGTGNLTKVVRVVARCDRCSFEREFKPGDEGRKCPSCGHGPHTWSGGGHLTPRFDEGRLYL